MLLPPSALGILNRMGLLESATNIHSITHLTSRQIFEFEANEDVSLLDKADET